MLRLSLTAARNPEETPPLSALPADAPVEMLRAALDALPEPVFVYDDSCVLYANQAACDILRGSSVDQVLRMDVNQFILPGFDEISTQRRTYVLKGGINLRNLVIKIRGMDGEPLTLRVNIRQIQFDGRTAAMGTLASVDTPISRKPPRASHHAGDAQSLHEAVLCALETAVLVHGDRIILFANPAALTALHAADATQLIGADITSIVHPHAIEAGHERRKLVLENKHVLKDLQLKLRTIDGRTVYVSAHAQRIEWDDQQAILVVATFPADGPK